MNKIEAQKQIDELKAKLAELEANVKDEPEYKPKDLVGKLCYLGNHKEYTPNIRVITEYNPYCHPPYRTSTDSWIYALPVPEEEVLKLIYKPKKITRYDWSKFPERAKFIYTDSNGDIFWSNQKAMVSNIIEAWTFYYTQNTEWHYISQGNAPCPYWKESEEARPE